jgi:hypothetical protein
MLNYTFELKTKRFDQTSVLPDHHNAGNKLYGQDFASWIISELGLADFKVIDEDWGWLVYGKRDGLEVDYCISDWGKDETPDDDRSNWYVILHAYKKGKLLGLIPWRTEINCPERYGLELLGRLQKEGIGIKKHGFG